MKFNVELEIDWIGEDGSIDEEVSNNLQNHLTNKVFETVKTTLESKITNAINIKLDSLIEKTYDDFLNQELNLTDKWGDIIREKVSPKQLLKEKLDESLKEKVDSSGRKSSYGISRYEHLLESSAKAQIDTFIKNISNTIIIGIKEDINEAARKRITDAILTDYSLKDLVR